MRPCTHCGLAIENNVRVCPSCRQDQPVTVGLAREAAMVSRGDAKLELPQLEEDDEASIAELLLVENMTGVVFVFLALMVGLGYLLAGVTGLLTVGGMMLIAVIVAVAYLGGC